MWKNSSQCLSINNIEVIAPIGVFEFEKEIKNTFLVSVDIWADFTKSMTSDKLEDTLDYSTIYDIVHSVLSQGGDLIEHSAQMISREIEKINFPIFKYKIKINKLNPPLSSSVSDTCFQLIVEK